MSRKMKYQLSTPAPASTTTAAMAISVMTSPLRLFLGAAGGSPPSTTGMYGCGETGGAGTDAGVGIGA